MSVSRCLEFNPVSMTRSITPQERRDALRRGASSAPKRRRTDIDALVQSDVTFWARGAWRPRLRAAGIHLGLSSVAAAVIVACVLWLWYPGALASVHGVHTMLILLLGVDLVLGPALTFLVFDRRKKSLPMDLAIIVTLQIIAMAYGVHVIQQGRPIFVVLVKDRFEVVSPASLPAQAGVTPEGAGLWRTPSLVPQWIAVKAPGSIEQRNAILFESLAGGRDLQHHPALYVPLGSELPAAAARAISIERLRQLNPQAKTRIDEAIEASRLAESELRVIPLRGPVRDAAVLVALPTSQVLKVLVLNPW